MKTVKCACCGGSMKRNGKTSSGAQRWRCAACGASATVRYDDAAARLEEFLSWLLSKGTQLEMPGAGRTFRRRTSEFWEVWPMPVPDGELHRVLFVDGIWLAEHLVVLICCSGASASSRGTWRNPRTRGRGRRSWSRYRRPTSWSPTAGAASRRPCARPGPGPRSRDACSTRSARSKGARRQGRSFRRAGSCTGSRSTSCISRRCTRRSCGASATSTGAASGPTSSRTPRSSTGGGSTPTRGSERRGGRCPRWSRRGRSSPTSIPGSRRPARSLRPTTG